MRRGLAILVAALVPLLAVGTGQAAEPKRFATVAEIEFATYIGGGAATRFIGDVHSQKPRCEKRRELTLIYRLPDGGDDAVASTTTDRTGDWALTLSPSDTPDGEYVVKVARRKIKKAAKKIVCKGATSQEAVLAD
jgi:hypothetical protein